jgi:hypothetical protein
VKASAASSPEPLNRVTEPRPKGAFRLRRLPQIRFHRLRGRNPRIGQFHQPRAAAAQRNGDLAQRHAMKLHSWRMPMHRTTHPMQLLPCRLLEPFNAYPIGVLEHHEHFSMRLFQTRLSFHVIENRSWGSRTLGKKRLLRLPILTRKRPRPRQRVKNAPNGRGIGTFGGLTTVSTCLEWG